MSCCVFSSGPGIAHLIVRAISSGDAVLQKQKRCVNFRCASNEQRHKYMFLCCSSCISNPRPGLFMCLCAFHRAIRSQKVVRALKTKFRKSRRRTIVLLSLVSFKPQRLEGYVYSAAICEELKKKAQRHMCLESKS